MCITVIPGINQNTLIDQSTSSHLADLKETSGKARTSTERRFKGAKRCSVCETCTQTGYSMEQEALSNPLLSCLEQIRQHLRAEAENAPKKQTTMQKCECRCFAEKSTSVRSVDGKTVKGNAAPSAAAAFKNKRRKTPLKTQKIRQFEERLKSSKKDEPNDVAFEEDMTQDQPGCQTRMPARMPAWMQTGC
ncbi:GL22900 [Drosophila persimilis]|uniref:GL22900 n=1 Tax=Drosophila persimilis TaxID=7234 RepID=B4H020_DROPE|nr:GL22900 [Drosophila persimilis]